MYGVFILLLHVSINCNETLYFRQGTKSSRDGITYHNVTSLSSQLGEKICAILPAFHSLIASDFTKPFFGRSKIESFRKLLSKPESMDLMSPMSTDHVDIEKTNGFCVTRNLQSSETRKITWRFAVRCCVLEKAKKKFTPTKSVPPDQKSLTMKIIRAHLVSHSWANCLDCNYQSLDPLSNGWIFVDGDLQILWYEGASLPSEELIQNYLWEKSKVLRCFYRTARRLMKS